MEIQITTEKFHESNHTTCAESFKSSEYYDLDNSNTQACEQTNSKLRSIATSCAFMNPQYYDLDNSNTRLLHPQHLGGIWSGLMPYRMPFDTLIEYPEPWLQQTRGSLS